MAKKKGSKSRKVKPKVAAPAPKSVKKLTPFTPARQVAVQPRISRKRAVAAPVDDGPDHETETDVGLVIVGVGASAGGLEALLKAVNRSGHALGMRAVADQLGFRD